jgi:hypothetical protein
MDIDWSLVAEPQLDGYDSEVALTRLLARGVARYRPPGNAPTIFDGAVAVRPLEGPYLSMEGFSSAPPEDKRIHLAEYYVRQWPAAFQQFKYLMYSFYPLHDLTGSRLPSGKGSISHSFQSHIGTMCATVVDPVCLAEAFVHEMAHNKLRALGIMVESAQELITNDPKDLYPSPILIGTPRPMTAVFHAEYSFIYVTKLNLMMLAADPGGETKRYIMQLLRNNVSRMKPGLRLIQDSIEVDSNGRLFVDGFINWAMRTIAEGQALLDKESMALAS